MMYTLKAIGSNQEGVKKVSVELCKKIAWDIHNRFGIKFAIYDDKGKIIMFVPPKHGLPDAAIHIQGL